MVHTHAVLHLISINQKPGTKIAVKLFIAHGIKPPLWSEETLIISYCKWIILWMQFTRDNTSL